MGDVHCRTRKPESAAGEILNGFARMRVLHSARPGVMAMAFVVLATIAAHALTFPALTGRVVDEAGILDAATKQAMTEKLAAVEAKSGDQIVVVTLKSLQDTSIEDYGFQLGRAWAIGQKDKNNGAVLIVVPSERKVRIEVGYGLEGALTDAVTRLIIQNAIVPRFRAGDFAGGISRGVDDIIQVVSRRRGGIPAARRATSRYRAKGRRCCNGYPRRVHSVHRHHDDAKRPGRRPALEPARRIHRADLHSIGRLVGILRRKRWRIFRRRRLVRRRRIIGELVAMLSELRPRTCNRGHPRSRDANLRRDLLRVHARLERLSRVSAGLCRNHRAAGAVAAAAPHSLAGDGHLSAAAFGVSGRSLSRDARTHPLSAGAAPDAP